MRKMPWIRAIQDGRPSGLVGEPRVRVAFAIFASLRRLFQNHLAVQQNFTLLAHSSDKLQVLELAPPFVVGGSCIVG